MYTNHRMLACEAIPVRTALPEMRSAYSDQSFAAEVELQQIIDDLRRAIRPKNMATEETYVNWNYRYTRFCHQKIGQLPLIASPLVFFAKRATCSSSN
ncbi:MAG: hypothetical protein JHD23_07425 [Akkermansiaceae bacterium]|nr:hypothetical protein [Akkermansiaceae bacterium]